MLVLSRKKGETICIGADVTVTINDIRGDRVSVAIQAPRHIAVDRFEIRGNKIQGDKRNASLTNKPLNMEGFACGYCGNSPCSCPPDEPDLDVG